MIGKIKEFVNYVFQVQTSRNIRKLGNSKLLKISGENLKILITDKQNVMHLFFHTRNIF